MVGQAAHLAGEVMVTLGVLREGVAAVQLKVTLSRMHSLPLAALETGLATHSRVV